MSSPEPVDQVDLDQVEEPISASAVTWRALDRAHSRVSNELSHALRRHHHLSLNAHAVLSQLEQAPDYKLRMTEIATRIDFSLSGLTGLVGRLEQDGLIERQSNFADRRVIYARLTEVGKRYAREANCRHQTTLDGILNEEFTPEELELLTGLLQRIAVPQGTSPR